MRFNKFAAIAVLGLLFASMHSTAWAGCGQQCGPGDGQCWNIHTGNEVSCSGQCWDSSGHPIACGPGAIYSNAEILTESFHPSGIVTPIGKLCYDACVGQGKSREECLKECGYTAQ